MTKTLIQHRPSAMAPHLNVQPSSRGNVSSKCSASPLGNSAPTTSTHPARIVPRPNHPVETAYLFNTCSSILTLNHPARIAPRPNRPTEGVYLPSTYVQQCRPSPTALRFNVQPSRNHCASALSSSGGSLFSEHVQQHRPSAIAP